MANSSVQICCLAVFAFIYNSYGLDNRELEKVKGVIFFTRKVGDSVKDVAEANEGAKNIAVK